MPGRTINKVKAEKIVKVEEQVQEEEQAQEKEQNQEEQAQEKEQVQDEQPKQEEELEEEKTKKLFALYPILFESHQYKIGEQLPTHNIDMVNAWVESEAAIWK